MSEPYKPEDKGGGVVLKHPSGYVPVVQLERNGQSVVTGLKVYFYLWKKDPNLAAGGEFVKVSNLKGVATVIPQLSVSLTHTAPGDVRTIYGMRFDLHAADLTQDHLTATVDGEGGGVRLDDFVFPAKTAGSYDTSKKLIWIVGVNYTMFGSDYAYRYQCNTTDDVYCDQ